MKNRDKIFIEQKDYKDRSEYRIKTRTYGVESYLTYIRKYIFFEDSKPEIYCFYAIKYSNFLAKLLFGNYETQVKKAISKCNKLIIQFQYDNEEPKKITKHNINIL